MMVKRKGDLKRKLRERFGDQAFDSLGYIKEEFVEKLLEEARKEKDLETIRQAVFYFNFVVKRRKTSTENKKDDHEVKIINVKKDINSLIKI